MCFLLFKKLYGASLNTISHSFALLIRDISWSTLKINFIFRTSIVYYSLFISELSNKILIILLSCTHMDKSQLLIVISPCLEIFLFGRMTCAPARLQNSLTPRRYQFECAKECPRKNEPGCTISAYILQTFL